MAWIPIARRQYLVMRAIDQGAGIFEAMEAVASTALAHPEWDMDEKLPWPEWEKQEKADAKAARAAAREAKKAAKA